MSDIFSLNRGESNKWNYSDPSQPNYAASITGTVVEINEKQQINYQTKQPMFFDPQPGQMYGNPRLNIELIVQDSAGNEFAWQCVPRQGNNGYDALRSAIKAYDANANSITKLGGLMIRITTRGASSEYGHNNPRPWSIEILGAGTAPFRGVHEYQPPVVQQVPQMMPQQPMMQQPVAQPAYPQVPASPVNRGFDGAQAQQPMAPQQPVAPQAAPVAPVAPAAPAAPQPVVPQQSAVQPSIYDQDIPF